jgi:uncharacterized protein YdhG (YjbR/CyaY superfamily)
MLRPDLSNRAMQHPENEMYIMYIMEIFMRLGTMNWTRSFRQHHILLDTRPQRVGVVEADLVGTRYDR